MATKDVIQGYAILRLLCSPVFCYIYRYYVSWTLFHIFPHISHSKLTLTKQMVEGQQLCWRLLVVRILKFYDICTIHISNSSWTPVERNPNPDPNPNPYPNPDPDPNPYPNPNPNLRLTPPEHYSVGVY